MGKSSEAIQESQLPKAKWKAYGTTYNLFNCITKNTKTSMYIGNVNLGNICSTNGRQRIMLTIKNGKYAFMLIIKITNAN